MDPLRKKFAALFSKFACEQIEKMLFDSIKNNDVDALLSIIKNPRSTPEQKKRALSALEKVKGDGSGGGGLGGLQLAPSAAPKTKKPGGPGF